ncbi:hypothetical protein NHQ30_003846 [Ciborinia camelliae]|nr:hypothetical protein NHQ30_003846 [Ciborinia camelliae]
MVVLPSNGHRNPQGIKREHDRDNVYDVSPKNINTNDNASANQNTHQHKKKKNHHHQHQNGQQSGEGEKKKKKHKSKHNSHQSQSRQEDTMMSGGLEEMSAELGEPILPPARSSQNSTPTMPKAMKEKHGYANGNGSGGKKKKNKVKNNKTVHFEGLGNDHGQNGQNGNAAQRGSILPVRSQGPILPPSSSPILPSTRPRSYSSNSQTPILPPASPSRMNLLRVSHMNQTPILPPISPFRQRRGSTGNAFSEPPPTFSVEPPRSQATQPASTKSVEPKPSDDHWEFSTGKIRVMTGNPMEKDTQREESKSHYPTQMKEVYPMTLRPFRCSIFIKLHPIANAPVARY